MRIFRNDQTAIYMYKRSQVICIFPLEHYRRTDGPIRKLGSGYDSETKGSIRVHYTYIIKAKLWF